MLPLRVVLPETVQRADSPAGAGRYGAARRRSQITLNRAGTRQRLAAGQRKRAVGAIRDRERGARSQADDGVCPEIEPLPTNASTIPERMSVMPW